MLSESSATTVTVSFTGTLFSPHIGSGFGSGRRAFSPESQCPAALPTQHDIVAAVANDTRFAGTIAAINDSVMTDATMRFARVIFKTATVTSGSPFTLLLN